MVDECEGLLRVAGHRRWSCALVPQERDASREKEEEYFRELNDREERITQMEEGYVCFCVGFSADSAVPCRNQSLWVPSRVIRQVRRPQRSAERQGGRGQRTERGAQFVAQPATGLAVPTPAQLCWRYGAESGRSAP